MLGSSYIAYPIKKGFRLHRHIAQNAAESQHKSILLRIWTLSLLIKFFNDFVSRWAYLFRKDYLFDAKTAEIFLLVNAGHYRVSTVRGFANRDGGNFVLFYSVQITHKNEIVLFHETGRIGFLSLVFYQQLVTRR
jgi:hypothetical protein